MTYEDVHAWTKTLKLVINRVKIINDTTDSQICKLHYRRGKYHVEVGGCEYVSFKVYDLDSIDAAFSRLDSLSDGIWYMWRSGEFTRNQRTMSNTPLCNGRLSTAFQL